MGNITYTVKSPTIRNVYRSGIEVVVLPSASFPDICLGCGRPAWRNVITREFFDLGELCLFLPLILDVIAYLLRKRYIFDFPFCSSCPPGSFPLKKIRIDHHLGIFVGAPKLFLDSLPIMPPDVAEERNRSWLRRRFRWLCS
jgi:hypothetical protein